MELKRYCVQLLHEFGSIEYTRKICDDLAKEIYEEIKRLNGNPYLENLIQNLMDIFRNEHEAMNNQEKYITDQIDEDEQAIREYKKMTNGRYHT